jgi:hypothetical protein
MVLRHGLASSRASADCRVLVSAVVLMKCAMSTCHIVTCRAPEARYENHHSRLLCLGHVHGVGAGVNDTILSETLEIRRLTESATRTFRLRKPPMNLCVGDTEEWNMGWVPV